MRAIKTPLKNRTKEWAIATAIALAAGLVALSLVLRAYRAPSIQTFIRQSENGRFADRVVAIDQLGDRGASAESAVPALIEILNTDTNSLIRASAAIALAKIGNRDAL